MGFQSIPKVAPAFLRNLKTIPFLPKARKKPHVYSCRRSFLTTASKKKGYQIFSNNQDGEARKIIYKMKPGLVREKKSLISPSLWKGRRGLLF
jgi:hypothetical protein